MGGLRRPFSATAEPSGSAERPSADPWVIPSLHSPTLPSLQVWPWLPRCPISVGRRQAGPSQASAGNGEERGADGGTAAVLSAWEPGARPGVPAGHLGGEAEALCGSG